MRAIGRHLAAVLVAGAAQTATAEPAEAPVAYDPSDYLKLQEFEEAKKQAAETIHPTNVVIGGIPYIKLESNTGAIYVPKLIDLKPEDLDRALCGNSFKDTDLNSAAVTAAELNLTEKSQLYAKLIVDTIHTKCDGSSERPPAQAITGTGLEIGVKVKEGKGRDPTTYSIFNQNLAPNIGVRADF